MSKIVNDWIVHFVGECPGNTASVIETYCRRKQWALEDEYRGRGLLHHVPSHLYFCEGGYFFQRLSRLVARGKLTALFIKGKNHYFPRIRVPIDINDPVGLKIAADWVEEECHNPVLAAQMRAATRARSKFIPTDGGKP